MANPPDRPADSSLAGFREHLADRYHLARELGQGGMATVYLAHDLKHDRDVALKVLRPELGAVLGAERFLREIRLTAKLQHPHILPLLDSGEAAGRFYYVMPYVEGETLRQRLERDRQLPIEEALRLTGEIADALDCAHQQGIIHRDIKPENILLSRGHALVADFGIALAVSQAGGGRLTETGLSLGTPAYMSPEQAMAEPDLDGRTDQYSLASVLYEMLAGEPPYTGPTAQAIIAKRLREPVPHLSTIRDAPPAVEAAVTRALAKAKVDRFGSVAEFARALSAKDAVRGPGISRRMVGLGAALVTLVVVAVLAFSRRGAAPAQPSAERQLTFTGDATSPAISPDGRKVAYVSYARGLVVQDLAGGDPTVLVPRARAMGPPHWTGDGAAILFAMMRDTVVDGRLKLMTTWLVPAAGGPAREVLQDQSPVDAGADSTAAAWVRRTPTNRIEIVGLSPFRVLRSLPVADSVGEIVDVVWSPDRTALAFIAIGMPGIWVVEADGGEPHRITRSGANPRWSAHGDMLYFLDGPAGAADLMRVKIDRKRLQSKGAPSRIASIPAAGAFDIGPDGLLIHTQVAQSAQALAMTLPAPGGGEVADRHFLTGGTALVSSISITADGRTVAYSRVAGGRSAIVLVPFEGGQKQELSTSDTTWSSPSLAPDGSRLAFARTDSNGTRAMVARLPGAEGPLSLGSRGAGWFGGALLWWSADGTWVAYDVDDRRRIGVVNLTDQSEVFVPVPDSLGTSYLGGALSPDGKQVVVSTVRQWNDWGELYLAPMGEGPWSRLREPFGESNPLRWTADGWLYLANHRVLISETGHMRMEVWRTNVPDGVPERVAVLPDGCGYAGEVAVSADGRRAVCVLQADRTDLMIATGLLPAAR